MHFVNYLISRYKSIVFVFTDQQEALRRFREKENDWERMRRRLEKQVTKLSESIASSRRNSLTPWGMSLLSWLNLDSDHASGQDDNDYEEGSHDGNNDDYVLSEDNGNNDGGYGTNGVVNTDHSDVMVLRSGSSVPVERSGGDREVMSRLRSRFRSRGERQSRSEARDRSPALSRGRSPSRSPTWSMWEIPSSGQRRFSRSRHSRPLSRHLSRTRPDLTSIPGSNAREDSSDDRRSRRRSRYYSRSRHNSGSRRSSASEDNWSYRDEDISFHSDQSVPYYTDGSDRDLEYVASEDASHHDSSSPVGVDTEEDTRTVVSVSDSHVSAEFSEQEESGAEAPMSVADTAASEPVSEGRNSTDSVVTVYSGSDYAYASEQADNADNDGSMLDAITRGSSDDNASHYGDDVNNSGCLDQGLQTYARAGVHTNESPVHDGYTDQVALPIYHDRELSVGETYSDPTPVYTTGCSGDKRETHEESRLDFSHLIRDSDIMVSAEETVGGENHAWHDGRNRTSSSALEGIGASRKKRRHDNEDDVRASRKRSKPEPGAMHERWSLDYDCSRNKSTEPRPSQERWLADYYSRDNSGAFRCTSRTESRPPTTVTGGSDPRAAPTDDTQTSSRPPRRLRHPVRRHTSVGRMSTLSNTSEPKGRMIPENSSVHEGASRDVHGKTTPRAARLRGGASTSAIGRGDISSATGGATVTVSCHRRHTIQSADNSPVVRSGHRSSRRHRDADRQDIRGGGDEPNTRSAVTQPPVDNQEASDNDDSLWLPDSDCSDSSDQSRSTEPTSDSSYEVLVPKSWLQLLNEYDSQDSDHSWKP